MLEFQTDGLAFEQEVPQRDPKSEKIQRGCQLLFAMVDADKSGSIDAKELGDALARCHSQLPGDALKTMFDEVDCDGSGYICAPEFVQYTIGISSSTSVEMAKKIAGQCKVELFFWLVLAFVISGVLGLVTLGNITVWWAATDDAFKVVQQIHLILIAIAAYGFLDMYYRQQKTYIESLEKTRIDLLNIMSKRLEESMLAAGDDSFDDLTEDEQRARGAHVLLAEADLDSSGDMHLAEFRGLLLQNNVMVSDVGSAAIFAEFCGVHIDAADDPKTHICVSMVQDQVAKMRPHTATEKAAAVWSECRTALAFWCLVTFILSALICAGNYCLWTDASSDTIHFLDMTSLSGLLFGTYGFISMKWNIARQFIMNLELARSQLRRMAVTKYEQMHGLDHHQDNETVLREGALLLHPEIDEDDNGMDLVEIRTALERINCMIPIEPLEFIYNELDKNGDQTVCASELSEYITHSTPLNAKQQISFKLKFTLTNINFWLDFIISVSIIVALVEETWNSSLQTDTRHRLKKTELVLFFIGCLGGGYTVYMLVKASLMYLESARFAMKKAALDLATAAEAETVFSQALSPKNRFQKFKRLSEDSEKAGQAPPIAKLKGFNPLHEESLTDANAGDVQRASGAATFDLQ